MIATYFAQHILLVCLQSPFPPQKHFAVPNINNFLDQ